jgi:hypothetical protein
MRSCFLVPELLNELDDEKTAVAFVVTDLGSMLGFMPDRHGPSLSLLSKATPKQLRLFVFMSFPARTLLLIK